MKTVSEFYEERIKYKQIYAHYGYTGQLVQCQAHSLAYIPGVRLRTCRLQFNNICQRCVTCETLTASLTGFEDDSHVEVDFAIAR